MSMKSIPKTILYDINRTFIVEQVFGTDFLWGRGVVQQLSEMVGFCPKNDRFQDNNTHTRISPAQGFCEGYFLERLMLLDR